MIRTRRLVAVTFCLTCGSCGGASGSTAGPSHGVDLGAGGEGGAQGGTTSGASGSVHGGGDSRVDLATFQSTGCVDTSASLPELLTGLDRDQYAGLQCIAWDATDGERLVLDLINFVEDAGFPNPEDSLWRGEAVRRNNGALGLTVEWDFEYQNAGGSCLQDFSFAIDGLRAEGALELEITTRSCSGTCPWKAYSVELPLGTKASGIVCRYADQLAARIPDDLLGSLHRRPAGETCDNGLVVVKLPDWDVCVAECSENGSVCPLADLLTCKESACMIADPW
jgi:hypothetical protein